MKNTLTISNLSKKIEIGKRKRGIRWLEKQQHKGGGGREHITRRNVTANERGGVSFARNLRMALGGKICLGGGKAEHSAEGRQGKKKKISAFARKGKSLPSAKKKGGGEGEV